MNIWPAGLKTEIANLKRVIEVAELDLGREREEIRRLNGEIQKLKGQVECQADNHEADRAEWAQAKRRLEEQLAAADRDHANLSGRLQDAEHAANLYQQHMARCAVADAIDLEDRMKRVSDL